MKNLELVAMNLMFLIWTIFNFCSLWTKSPAIEIETAFFVDERNIFEWVPKGDLRIHSGEGPLKVRLNIEKGPSRGNTVILIVKNAFQNRCPIIIICFITISFRPIL